MASAIAWALLVDGDTDGDTDGEALLGVVLAGPRGSCGSQKFARWGRGPGA